MNSVTRRDFLKFSAAAGLAASVAPTATWAATPASENPFKRSGKPRLKLSLAAYSFRENFPIMRGKLQKAATGRETDMFKFIDYCAAQGCISRVGFTADELVGLKKGAKAVFTIVPAVAPDKTVDLDLSLKGFTDGFTAVKTANAAVKP